MSRVVFSEPGASVPVTGLDRSELDGIAAVLNCVVEVGGEPPAGPETRVAFAAGRGSRLAAERLDRGAPRRGQDGPRGARGWTASGEADTVDLGRHRVVFSLAAAPTVVVRSEAQAGRPVPLAALFAVAAGRSLAVQGVLPLHAAAVEVCGRSVLAAGGNRAGKTTLAAATLACGGRVVSDDSVLCRSGAGTVRVSAFRRDLSFRADTPGLLPPLLRARLEREPRLAEPRWRLSRAGCPDVFTAEIVPDVVWLTSVDPSRAASVIEPVDQAGALAGLLRSATVLFLSSRHPAECALQLAVLRALAEARPALRVRLGGDLLADPGGTVERLLDASWRG